MPGMRLPKDVTSRRSEKISKTGVSISVQSLWTKATFFITDIGKSAIIICTSANPKTFFLESKYTMPTIAPPKKKILPKISPDDGSGSILGWDSQVVLFNDDVNTFEHVIDSLMAVFGREQQPARFCAE